MRSNWRDGERSRAVELAALGPGRWRATVDGAPIEVTVEPLGDDRWKLISEAGSIAVEVTRVGARRFVRLAELDFVLEREVAGRKRSGGTASGSLEAPMPGVVTRVLVKVGETVSKAQPLLAIEAMKMEHVIRAPHAGVVKTIAARVGEMVQSGRALVELDGSA